jgi:ArsR family transcriptional regulator, lead/cadmium/zinc/bismuth-responsive transcriptional repressor
MVTVQEERRKVSPGADVCQKDICLTDEVHVGAVEAVRQQMPDQESLLGLAEVFKVLGDHTRVRILLALAVRELCVCDLAMLLDMSSSAISHQLRVLRGGKVVRYRREGKNVFYSLDDQHIHTLLRDGLEHVRE